MSGKIENLNPISKSGQLSFRAFVLTLVALVVFNLIVYAVFQGQVQSARASLDPTKIAVVYGAWTIFSILGFYMCSHTFIKRWAWILNVETLGAGLRTLIRFAMLSPLLGIPLVFVTFLFFPRSPVLSVRRGGSKPLILSALWGAMVLSIVISAFLPASFAGFEKLEFDRSLEPYVTAFQSGKNPIPSEKWLRPVFTVLPPSLRYISWMGLDGIRVRALARSVEFAEDTICTQRMGYLGVEIPDCFFWNLRAMTEITPLASPLFAFFYEALYRQRVLTVVPAQTPSALKSFASSMLMISNQIELIELTKMLVPLNGFFKPSWLLHAFGSPEIPLLHMSADAQRFVLRNKILPIIELQAGAVQDFLERSGSVLGTEEIAVKAEMRDLTHRIEKFRRDPLDLPP